MSASAASFLESLRQQFAQRRDTEHLQALLRLVALPLLALWFLMLVPAMGWGPVITALVALGIYGGLAVMLVVHVASHPEVSVVRRVLTILLDISGVFSLFLTLGLYAGPALFLFSWIPLSNGFRYGPRYLYFAAVVSALAMFLIFRYHVEWDMLGGFDYGLIVSHALVAAYTGLMIGRLKDARRRLGELAMRDGLTGLPNRRLFIEHLRHMMVGTRRTKSYAACFYMDLDGFKDVNDRWGHGFGDRLLGVVAQAIRGALRDDDVVARLSGDEFVVAAQCEGNADEMLALGADILKAIETVTSVDGKEVRVSASIGVALYRHGKHRARHADPDTLINQADRAMYLAKRSGKGRVELAADDTDIVPLTRQTTTVHRAVKAEG